MERKKNIVNFIYKKKKSNSNPKNNKINSITSI